MAEEKTMNDKLLIVAVGTTVAGMLGLAAGVPYSGWVLFVGLFALAHRLC